MPSRYIHESEKIMEEKQRRRAGLPTRDEGILEDKLKPRSCPRCREVNKADSKFCSNCGSPLDIKTVVELEEKREEADQAVYEILEEIARRDPRLLIQVMRERGWGEKLTQGI
jgi:hypothetical protein